MIKNWGLHYSDSDGVNFGGFRWKPIGCWTEAQDWNPEPQCGGGLHIQTIKWCGYVQGDVPRIVEYDPTQIRQLGDKLKVARARVVETGQSALDLLAELVEGVWPGSIIVPANHTLSLTSVGGNCELRKEASAPALTSVGGRIYLYEGASAPALTSVGGYCELRK